jgi:DNA-binding Lrp family transcriptional regulator
MISIRLSDHNRLAVDDSVTDLLAQPKVLSVFFIGGNIDFLLHVTVSDSRRLRDFVFNQLTVRPEVNQVESALVYEYRSSQKLPKF